MVKINRDEAVVAEITRLYEILDDKKTKSHIDEKTYNAIVRQVKNVEKYAGKKPVRKPATNSGLQKKMPVSAEMRAFAGVDHELSRVDVTRLICEYIKEHDLQNPENKKEILLDAELKKLLKYDGTAITYPHIQKYLNHHMKGAAVDEAAAVEMTRRVSKEVERDASGKATKGKASTKPKAINRGGKKN